MGIGIALPARSDVATGNLVETLLEQTTEAASFGLDAVWFPQRWDFDAVTMATLAGSRVPGIGVGTSIVPIYPRHPIPLAAQAQTAQAATGGRFTLGLGLSGRSTVESSFGISYEKPIRHLREQLTALRSLFRTGSADVAGETLTARTAPGAATLPGATPPPVLVAAMGTQALRATGELAEGTLPRLAGPKTIASHIVPTITVAAQAAGNPPPEITALVPTIVTGDVAAVRARIIEIEAFYEQIPSYRAVLDREGVDRAGDIAIIGDEETVAARVADYFDAGATGFVGVQTGYGQPGDRMRTWRLLGELARARRD